MRKRADRRRNREERNITRASADFRCNNCRCDRCRPVDERARTGEKPVRCEKCGTRHDIQNDQS